MKRDTKGHVARFYWNETSGMGKSTGDKGILVISRGEAEKAMATHSRTLAWKTPWTEEPGRLQSMGSWRVGHDWATSLSRIGEGNGNPLQCSCLENPRDGGAWWAAVYGVAQSRTRLKRLSSSTSSRITCGFYFILQAFILNSYFFNEHVLFLYYSLNICLLFSCLVKRGRTEGGEKRDILIMFFIFRKQLAW